MRDRCRNRREKKDEIVRKGNCEYENKIITSNERQRHIHADTKRKEREREK